jgi:hypothetical protein
MALKLNGLIAPKKKKKPARILILPLERNRHPQKQSAEKLSKWDMLL